MWRLLFTTFVALALSSSVVAQWSDTTKYREFEGQPLDRVLVEIQNRTSNNFAFEPRVVSHIVVRLLGEDPVSTVPEFLRRVLVNTGLNFKVISGVYAIFPDKDQVLQRNFSVFGLIADSSSGEALPYATIRVLNTRRQTISNSEGRFSLLNLHPDSCEILVTYLGYWPLQIKADTLPEGEAVALSLTPKQQLLPPVNIESANVEMIQVSPNSGELTFNPATISRLPNYGEDDVFASMKWLPGLTTTAETENSTAIRGSDGSNTLITFDGMTVYHSDHLFGMFSAFNSNIIKNVRLYKGGFDTKSGERTGGVIEIIGKDGSNSKPSLLFQANLISLNALLEAPIIEDKASLVVAFRRSYTDLFSSNPFRKLFNNVYSSSGALNQKSEADAFAGGENPDFYFYDSNIKVTFKPTEKDAISMSYYQSGDHLSMNFQNANPAYTFSSTDSASWGNVGGSLKWSRQWNSRYYSYLIAGISNYQNQLTALEEVNLPSGELFSRRFLDSRTTLRDLVFRQDNSFQINSRQQLEFGLSYNSQELNLEAQGRDRVIANSTEAEKTAAFYLQNTSTWNKWRATYGFRGTHYTGTSSFYVQPRTLLSYQIHKRWVVKASAGRYIQQVQRLNEQGLYLNIPETWVLSGHQNVPVQKSDFLSLGASFSGENISVNVDLYQKSEIGITDLLFPERLDNNASIGQFSIGGERRIRGLDALLIRKTRNANYWLSYSWIFSQSKFEGINNNTYFQGSAFPQHEGKVVAQWNYKSWFFSAAFAVASAKYYTPVAGIETEKGENGVTYKLVTGEINSAHTGIYHRADISIGYILALQKTALEAGASLYNIYNSKNMKYIDYYITTTEAETPELGERKIYGLGTVPMIYLKFRM